MFKFCYVLVYSIVKEGIAVVKSAYWGCCDGFSNGKWYKPANMAKITDMVKTATTCFWYMLFEIELFIKRYSEILNWGGWCDTLTEDVCRGKAIELHAALRYQWWEIQSYLHLALIYCFSSKGKHLGDNPWAGLESNNYLVWSKKHRFVYRLHKGDDRSCENIGDCLLLLTEGLESIAICYSICDRLLLHVLSKLYLNSGDYR